MQGRKPKPNELKVRNGSKHAKDTVVVGGRARPRVPAKLSPRAKTAWKNLVEDMDAAGILDKADWPLIEVAANTIAFYRHAVDMCNTEGMIADGQKGNPTTSPWYRIANEQAKEIRQLLEHLGIGPVGRSRLGLSTSQGKSLQQEMNDQLGALRVVQGGKA